MAKILLDHVVLRSESVHMDVLAQKVQALIPIAVLGTKIFSMDNAIYEVDFTVATRNVAILADKLTTTKQITASDVVGLPSIFKLRERTKTQGLFELEAVREPYSLYCADLMHESNDWPVKKVMNGSVLLLGDTGSGKTTYMRKSLGCDVIVRYSEPQEDGDAEERVVPCRSLASMVTTTVCLSLLGLRVAVDSIRSLVYGMKGNAVEGGLSAGIYDFNTQMNNLYADIGVVVVIAINPLFGLGDKATDKADSAFQRLASGCAGAVHLENRGRQRAMTYRLTDGRITGSGGSDMLDIPVQKKGISDPANVPRENATFTVLNSDRLKDSELLLDRFANPGLQRLPTDEGNQPLSPRPTALFTL